MKKVLKFELHHGRFSASEFNFLKLSRSGLVDDLSEIEYLQSNPLQQEKSCHNLDVMPLCFSWQSLVIVRKFCLFHHS